MTPEELEKILEPRLAAAYEDLKRREDVTNGRHTYKLGVARGELSGLLIALAQHEQAITGRYSGTRKWLRRLEERMKAHAQA